MGWHDVDCYTGISDGSILTRAMIMPIMCHIHTHNHNNDHRRNHLYLNILIGNFVLLTRATRIVERLDRTRFLKQQITEKTCNVRVT